MANALVPLEQFIEIIEIKPKTLKIKALNFIISKFKCSVCFDQIGSLLMKKLNTYLELI